MNRKRTPTLIKYAEQYIAERDVCPLYQMQIRLGARRLCEFAGRVLMVHQLNCDLMNRWIVSMLSSGLSPFSVSTYRNNVLAMWNAAYMERLNDDPPLRIRKVKKPRMVIEC